MSILKLRNDGDEVGVHTMEVVSLTGHEGWSDCPDHLHSAKHLTISVSEAGNRAGLGGGPARLLLGVPTYKGD